MGQQAVTSTGDGDYAAGSEDPPPISSDAIEKFLRQLRASHRFAIGPREHLAAITLVGELISEGYVRAPHELHDYLAPVLIKSKDDAARFRSLFDGAFPQPHPRSGGRPAAQIKDIGPLPDDRTWLAKWWPVLAAVTGTLLMVGLVWLVRPDRSDGGLFAPAPVSQPSVATPTPLQPVATPRDEQAGVIQADSPAEWLALSIAVGLLGVVVFWLSRAVPQRRAYIRRRLPHDQAQLHRLISEQESLRGRRHDGVRRAAQLLSTWTLRETEQIDVTRTVEGSILRGHFSPVRASVFARPDYLILIEARGVADHSAQRLRDLVRQLQQEQMHAEVFYYQRTPELLYREDEQHGSAAPFSGAPTPLAALAFQYSNHRLLILGSGTHFLQPSRPLIQPGLELLQRWDKRALLTPVALAEWGNRELTIAIQLQLPIGRATVGGLFELARLLGLAGERAEGLLGFEGDAHARELPSLLRANEVRWTLDTGADWPELRAKLVSYLDEEAYAWLCACAVYPEVRWDLTLFLGLTLSDALGRTVYREDRLAELVRLPWFREGRIPDWIRAPLIRDLGSRSSEIQTALRQLVESASPQQPQSESAVALTLASEGRGTSDDQLFIDFLSKPRPTDFAIRAAAVLKNILPKQAARWADLKSLAIATTGLVGAGLAWLTAPRDIANLSDLPLEAWLPLDAVLLGTLLVMVAVNPSPLRMSMRNLVSAIVAIASFAAVMGIAVLLVEGCGNACITEPSEGGVTIGTLSGAALLLLAAAACVSLGRMLAKRMRGAYEVSATRRFAETVPAATALAAVAVFAALQLHGPFPLGGRQAAAVLAGVVGIGLFVWAAIDIAARSAAGFREAVLTALDGALDIVSSLLGVSDVDSGEARGDARESAVLKRHNDLSDRLKQLSADGEAASRSNAQFWASDALKDAAAAEVSSYLESNERFISCDRQFRTPGFRSLLAESEEPVLQWLARARRFAQDCRAEIAMWERAAKDGAFVDSDSAASEFDRVALQCAAAQEVCNDLRRASGERYEPTSVIVKLPLLIGLQFALGSLVFLTTSPFVDLQNALLQNVFRVALIILLLACVGEVAAVIRLLTLATNEGRRLSGKRPVLATALFLAAWAALHWPALADRDIGPAIFLLILNTTVMTFSGMIFYGLAESAPGLDLALLKRDLLFWRLGIIASRMAGPTRANSEEGVGTVRLQRELQNLAYVSSIVQRQRTATLKYAFVRYAESLAAQERAVSSGKIVLRAPDGRMLTAGELRYHDFVPD
jgi:hypothetical protein